MASEPIIGSSVQALQNDPNGPLGRTSGGVPPDGYYAGRPLMPKNGMGPGDPYEESPAVVDDAFFPPPLSAPPGV